MKLTVFAICLFFSSIQSEHTLEQKETYEIIKTIINYLNPDIPLVDSLPPTTIRSKFIRKQISQIIPLNRKEKRLLKNSKNDKGILLDKGMLKDFKFYDNKNIMEAFKKNTFNIIQEKEPFYIASKPLFYNDYKTAILRIDLIGSFSSIFILKKNNNTWNISNSIPIFV